MAIISTKNAGSNKVTAFGWREGTRCVAAWFSAESILRGTRKTVRLVSVETIVEKQRMRHDSGSNAAGEFGKRVPDLGMISGAQLPQDTLQPATRRPFIVRAGKHLRGFFDWAIRSSSLISNDPVLDVRDFPWTQLLRDNWQAIRSEAVAHALGNGSPSLASVSPDHRAIAPMHRWRSFFLWGYGYAADDNIACCPVTNSIVTQIPGLNSAFFSILAPGTHIPAHRGVSKSLVTCHLGVIVPRDGDVRMRVDGRVVRWAEGETLVFDDTYDHEVWNDSEHTRVVLLIQFRRPLKQPGKWIADTFLSIIRKSAFVQDARTNVLAWNKAVRQADI